MSMENAILFGFAGSALVSGALLSLFFKRRNAAPPGPLTWRSWAAGNALILLFMGSLILTCGEIYYRFYYDATDAYMLSKAAVRWQGRHFQLNTTGFRDSIEYQRQIRPGMRRITFIGDSFTAGHGVKNVENRFANRIRSRHPDWDVHVMADIGWDTGTQLKLVESKLPSNYEFDVVVLAYCLNDISDLAPDYWEDMVRRITQTWQPGPIVLESYFLDTLYHRLCMALEPDLRNYYGFVAQWYRGPIWAIQEDRLRKMQEVVSQRGGQLLVVTFPFLQSTSDNYPFRDVHAKLDARWNSLAVPHLDLMEPYFNVGTKRLVVNRFDAHPNERAHELAAAAIDQFIQDHMAAR